MRASLSDALALDSDRTFNDAKYRDLVTEEGDTPSGARVRVGAALLDLGVRNLLDRTYAELRAGGFVSPGQPRSLFATVRYEF